MTSTAATVTGAPATSPEGLDETLGAIAATAGSRDADPERAFPFEAFAALSRIGALSVNAVTGSERPPAAAELTLVRRVAAADGSVGRIFDGHLNAVERLSVYGVAPLRDAELSRVRAGELIAGVWGGDPVGDEGSPAMLLRRGEEEIVRGVKTFCSGAGGLQRAAVLVGNADGTAPVLVWLDLTDERVEIDTTWYRAAGLVASVSHRVVFHDVPVQARLGEPGAISRQPWFGRDALRTAASWAGMADTAVRGALDALAARPRAGEIETLAAGRMLAARGTIDSWLQTAATAMDSASPQLADVALHARVGIAAACRALLEIAATACGSRPFAHGSDLDRARRDLELFLLQHRLEPLLARSGGEALEARRP